MSDLPQVLDQETRDAVANSLISIARRIQRSHGVPMHIHISHKRPMDVDEGIPKYAGNESFECKIEFERRVGDPVTRGASNPPEEETHEIDGKS